jgi:hypothetical protein
MKIRAETGLALWAVATAWLVLFVVLEPFESTVGEELIDALQFAAAGLAAAIYLPARRWFAAWLTRQR